jgi:hypothetical protein
MTIYRVTARHDIAGVCDPMNVRADDRLHAWEEYLVRCVQPDRLSTVSIEVAPKGSRPTARKPLR